MHPKIEREPRGIGSRRQQERKFALDQPINDGFGSEGDGILAKAAIGVEQGRGGIEKSWQLLTLLHRESGYAPPGQAGLS